MSCPTPVQERPFGPDVVVTDIVFRGGGGTITFSDNVTVEWIYKFLPDPSLPGGGTMTVTLTDPRASLVYQTLVDQTVCDLFSWLIQCTDIANRLALLELTLGRAVEVTFDAADWPAGIRNSVVIPASGPLGAGEVGPHNLDVTGRAYAVSVFEDGGGAVTIGVDVEIEIDLTTGTITLHKAPLAPNFSGRAIITAPVS